MDKLEGCISDMRVALEVGFALAKEIKEDTDRKDYSDSLERIQINVNKSEEQMEETNEKVEETQKHAIEVMSAKEEEKERIMEEKFKEREKFKANVAEESRESGRRGRVEDRVERKRDFKDSAGLKPGTISVDSSPEDVEIWTANTKLWANASNMNVLKHEDQKVLLCSILERDLYLSLNLTAGDDFMDGVTKGRMSSMAAATFS